MQANGAKPRDPKDLPRKMKEMMAMCCSGELGPADVCRRMMRSTGSTSEAEAQSATGSGTAPDERERSDDDDAPGGCCGPGSGRAPGRP